MPTRTPPLSPTPQGESTVTAPPSPTSISPMQPLFTTASAAHKMSSSAILHFSRADSATSVLPPTRNDRRTAETIPQHADLAADFAADFATDLPSSTADTTTSDLCTTIIAPRSFNTLTLSDTLVTKTSAAASIRGELHFYLNIPPQLSALFPTLRAHTVSPAVSLTVDRVRGPTLSALLVAKRLTPACVSALLHTLHTLHSHATPPPHTPLLYANHHAKVVARFRAHAPLYARLRLTASSHFDELLARLRDYEAARRALPAAVVHGDPVLTNVLLRAGVMPAAAPAGKGAAGKAAPTEAAAGTVGTGDIRLIDMRGALGNMLTLAGDAVYDLAKVLQSLLGYDLVLADRALDAPAARRLGELLRVYWAVVRRLYPQVRVEDVVLVACALFSSLIPLHDDGLHRRLFAVYAATLLQALEDGDVGNASGALVHRIALQLAKAAA